MQTIEKDPVFEKCNWVQWIALLSVYMLLLQMGMFNGWASPNFARLVSEDSPIPATPADVSWMLSLGQLGSVLGAITGSILVEYIGSRKTIVSSYIVFSISWMCLLLATSVEWLYASRVLGGMPASMAFSCFAIYLGEISRPEIRGTLISLATTGCCTGLVLGIVIETYVSFKVSSSIYLTQALIGILMTLWLKDTPYWLAKKNDFEKAQKAIEFYRTDVKAEKELENIKNFVELNTCRGIQNKFRECQTPVIKASMFLIVVVCALPYLCGYANVTSYMEIILKSARFDLIDPQEFVIYSNLIGVLASILSIQLVDQIGRKLLVILSSVGTGAAMFGLGLHFYLLSAGYDAESLQWLPTISIVIYLIMYLIGYALIPGTLLSEIFPENIKSIAALVASMAGPICGLIVGKAYQPIVDSIGETYAFWIHALLALLGIPCALFLMIETKGKTFQEIQTKLSQQWN